MRRTTKIAAVLCIATLALAGCAKDDKKDSGSSATLDCGSLSGDGPKVGIAYDVGGQGDHSFNDSAVVGMKKAAADLGATCIEGEAQLNEPESAREDRLRQLADAGANPVIGVGFSYSESANAVAPDYPNISFGVIDGFDWDDKPNANVAYLDFAENEGSFLVGVAAALKTQADHIGFVGGVHNDLIKKFEAGYEAGAQAVNPDITIDVKYIEESDLSGFNDPAGAKAAAAAEYDNGADIVFHATGASGSGIFDAAVDAGDGMWAIGVDSDQYLSASADQQPHILTSMLKRVDTATYDMIQSVANGKPVTSYQTYDLAHDGVGYATSGGFIDDITDQIDEYAAKIKSGEIKVPAVPTAPAN
ncbi:MAG TPA: BMP family ABC transporter substrate-binding protein [Nocardioidaceae bacterium]|nr:BMP family ABC transporter substrate-binding protein [Nocardioidaceae bacterium]